jgi:hypothetical protein
VIGAFELEERAGGERALAQALVVLPDAGFSQVEIDMMIRHDPARFLGLE